MLQSILQISILTVGKGLAGVIDYLQSTVTWFINSHIASVRRTIDSKFIYDPAGIDPKSLEARTPYIALKKNVVGVGWIGGLSSFRLWMQHRIT